MKITKPFLFLLAFSVTSFSYATDTMQGDFRSMSSCLSSIEESSGKSIDKVVTDKPEKVSGFLSNGKHFSCTRKRTGTKGTYYEGYYTL